ncbi:Oidioi.mRNA.OKI2018_I69.chr1.g2291.t1.cds [Oikopleura dioica]|uniref:Oidioi.mRNA.OKI2018_I69.chr1.g2291.t1.cds n=1 Tax=Oikopleura dioica TaxID=34765 RepID=A0ABN7SUY3_OIKDI|nr:Oidioi.mRNA.OKI2018_I69.chr1.g2291.t1.cds [Oikopleura dioica]
MRILKIFLVFNFANAFTLMDPLVDFAVAKIWDTMVKRVIDTAGQSTAFTNYLWMNLTSTEIRDIIQNIDVDAVRDGGLTVDDFVAIFDVNPDLAAFDLTEGFNHTGRIRVEGNDIVTAIGANDATWNALLEAAELLQEIYYGEIDAYKFIGIFSDGFDALSSIKNSNDASLNSVTTADQILHWTFIFAEKAAFAYEKHEYYYDTMMYYVGMLQFHLENSYQGKIEDFCDAYPEEIDIFGIARDIVFFLQVQILPTLNSMDLLAFDAWNHFVENIPVLENYEVPKDWASIGYTTANYYLNGIDGSLEELEIISNAGFLFAGRSLASFATETVQDFICY